MWVLMCCWKYHRGKEYSDSERGASSTLAIVCVGKVAYRIELPSELSQLRKCLADESVHIPTNSVMVDENVERPNVVWKGRLRPCRTKRLDLSCYTSSSDDLSVTRSLIALWWASVASFVAEMASVVLQ
ncbi:hypothetical protein OSB04_019759, partial [Centaurea solstitialis]